ncbi:MAG: DUF3450 family protein [Myxococcota bacterium]
MTLKSAALVIGPLTLLSAIAFAAGLESLADQLIDLRGKVETLQDDIEAKQQDHRSRMGSSAARRASLDSEIQSKELQLRQLREAIAEQREKNRLANESAAAITPTLKRVAGVLKSYVEASLPFKRADRIQSIDELLKKVDRGDMSAPQALNRLWGLFEDEFRITRENGLFKQEIQLNGKEQLSDVIRLGTMMLFFRTNDGVVGSAQKSGDDYTYSEAKGGDADMINALFSAFEKQVRSGFFEIPNALVK